MYLVFWGTEANKKMIACCQTMEQANMWIAAYMEERNIHPRYWRYWIDANTTTYYDYGSWSEFFFVKYVADDQPTPQFKTSQEVADIDGS